MTYDFNEAKEHLVNSYGRLDPVIVKGHGVYLYDQDNNKYLDFTSGIGVSSLGYGHKKWVEATSSQLGTLVHASNIFLTEPSVKLAKELTEKSKMKKIFFGNSGAEANEGAIKIARKYSFDKYGQGRNTILTLTQSFHGRTITTLKATGQEKFHQYFYPFTEGFNYVKANDLNDFKEKLTPDVCAIMLEAIQGEGGVILLDKDFVQEVVKMCNEKDVLVIFDEVQCGIARTGKLFGYENFDVRPDVVTVAKGLGAGLPIGGFLCGEKVQDVFQPGDHGSTFGANPVVCAGALVVLDELCNEKSYNEISEKGAYVKELIEENNNPQVVDVRGMGLMLGIKVKCSPSLVQKECIKKGLFVLTAGKDVVRLLPPLVISKAELKNGIDILLDVLSEIK
ncbi:aspartate aminotransferase family protein [Clostridium butyricum]|uniref:aspartate aminotransferase family protein n=1 Tax=Clostridium butyricum TaxID=1492 RepID=UPI0005C1CBA7|nr:aspartate aminotransferase family protein [Clostridium butyricum]KIU06786.1 acetylornithine and succinylornithine aminotransferase [Clostridium butyricum]MBA8966621.1 acetylornithine/N-succinyldiaminopimelate aminotransferase [Clostridium butyricum]MBA8972315.1 acetylornithine/N-succinyldiaminopimelate aminotransferase [Clostridium butyricum]MBC2425939.1 aspartate aminotransferase family protein [Clostridium butyricum]NOW35822.1 acetylornithine/N-succinyldiaminopimelate aminotransferase [Cl